MKKSISAPCLGTQPGRQFPKWLWNLYGWLTVALVSPFFVLHSFAFSYVTAGGSHPANTVVHPAGYEGRGGTLKVTLALHSDFKELEEDFAFSGYYAAQIWNDLIVASTNLGPSIEIPEKGGTDVFGVLIHEMGHNLGLGHPALGPQRDLRNPGGKFTASAKGEDGEFTLNKGPDGVGGTFDDLRGDDINLSYFKLSDNNPFTPPAEGIYDSTTYSLDLEKLPDGHSFSTVADRTVAVSPHFELKDIEAIMVTGGSLRLGQIRRGLGVDDVAGIRYAMSGMDEIQGTRDDYTIEVEYIGVSDEADILVRFDGRSPFAGAGVRTIPLEDNHSVMLPNRQIGYNPELPAGRFWVFPVLEPFPTEVEAINPRAVQITMKTEVGKRYAITWPRESLREDESPDEIIVQFGGENVKPISGGLFLFEARDSETDVKIAFPDRSPDLDEIEGSQLFGKPLDLD